MIKNIENKNDSIKINDKEIAILKEHFPSCFQHDGSFDIAKLQEQLNDKVDIIHEGYELKFLGKSYAKLLTSLETTTIIKPDAEHNDKPENKNSENIYISGDNLDGLKHLLKSYFKQVKCIYIDEPYNTGTDGFVYNDKFNFTSEELQRKLSIDETQAQRIIDLTRRKSTSHSAWLMFMYPRLQLAKDLLTIDGVIFISVDDNEQSNLKLLCDEIFGEENFVAQFPRITKKAGKTTDLIAKNNDYILCYSRSGILTLNTYLHTDNGYKHSDEFEEERGKYKLSQTLDYGSIQYSKSLDYEIEIEGEIFRPGGVTAEEMAIRQKNNPKSDFCWRWSRDLYDFGLKNGFIVVKESSNGKRIYTKTYQNAIIEKE
ncbi:MAG: site-specific DNA-methyltransferase, partial [Bacteroidota bacterium]